MSWVSRCINSRVMLIRRSAESQWQYCCIVEELGIIGKTV